MESGLYSSADDVVGMALGLLEEHDAWLEDGDEALERELADLRESLRRATEQADAGLTVPAHVVFDEIRRRHDELVRGKRNEPL